MARELTRTTAVRSRRCCFRRSSFIGSDYKLASAADSCTLAARSLRRPAFGLTHYCASALESGIGSARLGPMRGRNPELLRQKRTWQIGPMAQALGYIVARYQRVASIWLGSNFDPVLREQIMVAVAEVNRCRYCVYTHSQWGQNLTDDAGINNSATSLSQQDYAETTAFARAIASDGFADSTGLRRGFAERYGEQFAADVELIARVMTWMNLSGNTVDSFLDRVSGTGYPDQSVVDELVVVAGFSVVAPVVTVGLAFAGRQGPLKMIREFRRVSRRLERMNPVQGDRFAL